jgi:mRNA interferase HicA
LSRQGGIQPVLRSNIPLASSSTQTVDFSFAIVNTSAYSFAVTVSEFRRWFKQQGCTFSRGKKHDLVHFHGKSTTIPRHPSQELGTGIVNAIKAQLGLSQKKDRN